MAFRDEMGFYALDCIPVAVFYNLLERLPKPLIIAVSRDLGYPVMVAQVAEWNAIGGMCMGIFASYREHGFRMPIEIAGE